MGREVTRTKDGFEMSIGVSYFGHFLLIESLLNGAIKLGIIDSASAIKKIMEIVNNNYIYIEMKNPR